MRFAARLTPPRPHTPIGAALILVLLVGCRAPNPAQGAPVNPTRLPDGRYRIGLVTLDPARRRVTFPAAVNLREGIVEYAVVTTRGKVHESVLRTPASPRDIHLALLLLGVDSANTASFPEDVSLPPPGEPVRIEVAWRRGFRTHRQPLEQGIRSTAGHAPLSRGPWAYNGSFLDQGVFAAEATGSIVALQVDPAALINNPRPGREDDTFHESNPDALPPRDTRVEITIEPLRSPR